MPDPNHSAVKSRDDYVRIQGDHHGQSQIGAVLGSATADGQAKASPVY
jgi:hypothetical protein